MNVFVRASSKSHIPGSLVCKTGCRLKNCHAYICAACVSTSDCICSMLYDVINYNYVTFAFSSYKYGINITFTGVEILKSFLVYMGAY